MNRKKNRNVKPAGWKFLVVLMAAVLTLGGVIFYAFAPRPGNQIPRYFMAAGAAKPLPGTLDSGQFSNKQVMAAYQAAKKSPEILAQQPCFCHCDRRLGHRSLLDCFTTRHAAKCDICVKEAIFAEREQERGKTADQIRAEIIQGAWKTVQVANQ